MSTPSAEELSGLTPELKRTPAASSLPGSRAASPDPRSRTSSSASAYSVDGLGSEYDDDPWLENSERRAGYSHRSLPVPLRRSGHPSQRQRHRSVATSAPRISTPKITVKEFMKTALGITDLNRLWDPVALRETMLLRLAVGPAGEGGMLVHLPFVLRQKIFSFLDARSLCRVCITTPEMVSHLSSRLLWRPLVDLKKRQQRTLVYEVSHDWKRTYVALHRLEHDPSYFDSLWNVVVIGDRRVGKSKLVQTLAESASLAEKRKHSVVAEDPVIDPVSGIYRLGIDFAARRVVVDNLTFKLQIWDRFAFNSVHVVVVVFDVRRQASFDALGNLMTEARRNLAATNSTGAIFIVFGNLTDGERVVSQETGQKFAVGQGALYLEANVSKCDSVDEAFARLSVEAALQGAPLKLRSSATSAAVSQHDNRACIVQ